VIEEPVIEKPVIEKPVIEKPVKTVIELLCTSHYPWTVTGHRVAGACNCR
jgi:hypothetical protein